jgi:hypothetical protein
MMSVGSDIRPSSRRWIAFVALSLLLGVLFAYPGSGLLLGCSSTEDGGIHRFHTVVSGMHTGFVLSLGLLVLLVRTEERVATPQQVGVAMAVMMAVFFTSVVIPHFGAPGVGIDRAVFSILVLVLTGVVLALHPRRGEILTRGRGISRPMAALGVVGLAVAASDALDQLRVQLAVDLAADPHSAGGGSIGPRWPLLHSRSRSSPSLPRYARAGFGWSRGLQGSARSCSASRRPCCRSRHPAQVLPGAPPRWSAGSCLSRSRRSKPGMSPRMPAGGSHVWCRAGLACQGAAQPKA